MVDIPDVFNLLIARPWIHTAGAIPFCLLPKAKFILGNKLISVMAEEDLTIPASALVPFMMLNRLAMHASRYNSFEFEFVSVNNIPKDKLISSLSYRRLSS